MIHVLREGGIPCYVWCEDALSYFGVPTRVFGLYILVDDADIAASLLIKHGWVLAPSDFKVPYNDIKEETRYLVKTQDVKSLNNDINAARSIIGLLSAQDWKMHLPSIDLTQDCKHRDDNLTMPPMLESLQAVLDKWLDTPDSQPRFIERLDIFLAYLYDYVAAPRNPDFGEYLKVEHRQYHRDMTSGMDTQGIRFRDDSRKHRDDIDRRQANRDPWQ